MKISKQPHLLIHSQPLNSPPDSSTPHSSKHKNPNFTSSGIRLRKKSIGGGGSGGKRGGPATPLLKWKFYDDEDDDLDDSVSNHKTPEDVLVCRRKVKNGGEGIVSARKLAAGLWQLHLPEFDGGGSDGDSERGDQLHKSPHRLGFEPGEALVDIPNLSHRSSGEFHREAKDFLHTSLVTSPKKGVLCKVEPSLPFLRSAREHATKWDSGCLKTSDEVYRFYSQMKLLEDQQITTTSVVSSLQVELEQARAHIHQLETERQLSKKKVKHFMMELADEKASWQRREHEKMRAVIDDAKDSLKSERKNCQRLEIVNSKLVNELTEAKLSAKRFMQNYEKERKERELMEDVCDELAKELGEEKAEIEALKRESMKIHEEVEEERKMLQMAEVWREERVQMKLIDAKLTLEEKYSQLNKLIADIEVFLRLRGVTTDMMEMKEVELLREASNLVNIPDMKEFLYKPQKSEDIFSVFEELQSGEPNEREIEPCFENSYSAHLPKTHTVNPKVKELSKNLRQRNSNGIVDQRRNMEEDVSGLDTFSNTEEQGSSFSPDGSERSVNKNRRDNVSGSLSHWEEIAETPNNEINEICSVSSSRLKKSSSISRLWRSNTVNGEHYKINSVNGEHYKITVEGTNGRFSTGRISNGEIISADEGGRSSADLEQWSSPDVGSLHTTRVKKGCIEWPHAIQKNTLKAKLLEARMESQKLQLRQVLKQNV